MRIRVEDLDAITARGLGETKIKDGLLVHQEDEPPTRMKRPLLSAKRLLMEK